MNAVTVTALSGSPPVGDKDMNGTEESDIVTKISKIEKLLDEPEPKKLSKQNESQKSNIKSEVVPEILTSVVTRVVVEDATTNPVEVPAGRVLAVIVMTDPVAAAV